MVEENFKGTHYPKYHVMEQQEHWDEHTRGIVQDRMQYTYTPSFLSQNEVETLKRICSHLVNDKNTEIIDYIIRHIDETLSSSLGEGERQEQVPEASILIRNGLEYLDTVAKEYNYMKLIESDDKAQLSILEELSKGNCPRQENWDNKQQKALFKKLLSLSVDAYYSHPAVWTHIGYGGPAYPRGYVRADIGLLDPWEAQTEPKKVKNAD